MSTKSKITSIRISEENAIELEKLDLTPQRVLDLVLDLAEQIGFKNAVKVIKRATLEAELKEVRE